jgi:phage tail tape-measure protein
VARYRYPRLAEMMASEDELADATLAQKAPGEASAAGNVVGSVIGGAAGFLPLLAGPAGAPLLAATIPAGAAIGGQVGNLIGGAIGGGTAEEAEKRLRSQAEARQKRLAALEMREQALADLQRLG